MHWKRALTDAWVLAKDLIINLMTKHNKTYNFWPRYKLHLMLTLLSIIVASCTQQDIDNATTQQETQIETYIKDLGAENVVVNSGVWRAVIELGKEGLENEVVKGDSIVYNYAAYLFSSGKGYLFDTNVLDLAEVSGIGYDYSYFVSRKEVVGKGKLISGLDIGLIGARVGERCYVVFSARHGFGNVQIGMIPKMSPLLIEVWIKEVKKN